MIIHFILDEKFTDMAIREFEVAMPQLNKWLILGKPRKLIHSRNSAIEFISHRSAISLVKSNICSGVIFHSLNDSFIPILEATPFEKNTIWIGWGYDYYGTLIRNLHPEGLLLEESKKLMNLKPWYEKAVPWAKDVVRLLLGRHSRNPVKAMERVSFFSPVLDIEYDIAKQENPKFNAQYICWNYGTFEDDLHPSPEATISGQNILLGNSATPENNHIETLISLAKHYDIGDRKIITPLSYGDPWYAERIVKFGEQTFGNQFHPLTDFIEKNEYLEIINSCSHAFMNHLRQQALGNVCSLLLNGAAMYMHPRSPLYAWLNKRGVHIFPIQNCAPQIRLPLHKLTPTQHQQNVAALQVHWGRAAQHKKTLALAALALRPRTRALREP